VTVNGERLSAVIAGSPRKTPDFAAKHGGKTNDQFGQTTKKETAAKGPPPAETGAPR
jgi:hypothetical protein